jgi:uncharacterized membrane protein HdeD (DUF308 family)
MQEQAKAALAGSAPWRRGVPWFLVGIEGLVLIGIGIYMVSSPSDARDVVRQLIAAIILINGLLEVIAGFRNPTNPLTPFRCLRGGVAVTIGLLVLLENVSDYLDADSSRTILAVGLLAYGLLGLVNVVAGREEYGLRIGPLITSALCIVLSILFFTSDQDDTSRIKLVGWVGIIFGVLLVAYGAYLYRSQKASADPGVPAASTA